ncbi:Growth arrest-specific protein 8 [Fasciolopsis buskii]|uniref:Dynein regulatory complex subunit 4 n=1 Tax=Fasciolopsis buskii TaxID=27845 RepID=A0A8E0VIK5_9TREM|nr:Growth arrest-specific protein 8 [Fasciolopsis buski]
MTKEEIEAYVVLLRDELDRERQERNLAVLEKDRIVNFWEVTKKNLEDSRALLSKKERELEDADERHQLEMKIYRQKLKHLMFEQNSREAEGKKESLQGLSNAKDEARAEVRAIRNENYTLKAKLRQQQVQSEEAVKMLKRKHELEMAHIRQDFARQTEEIEQRAGKQMAMLRDQVDTQRRVEVHMTEEHKNNHIHNLEANHERAFANMKAYYNDITLGNVSVIKTLRENIDELRSQLARIQRLLDSSQNEVVQKTIDLANMEKENSHLRHISKLYESEKSAHMLTKQNAKKTTLILQKTEANLDIMTARFDGLNKMRNTLAVQFERILLEVEQRMSLRSLLVERKLKHLAQILEAREAQINQLVISLEGDQASVNLARKHLENLLQKKNDVIDELQYEVMRMGKAYNELWSTCQRRLVEEMNSPVNLGIVPVKVNINLTSPFNAATAMGSRIDNEEQHSENMTNLGPPKDGLPKMGQGPAGMASVAPF